MCETTINQVRVVPSAQFIKHYFSRILQIQGQQPVKAYNLIKNLLSNNFIMIIFYR